MNTLTAMSPGDLLALIIALSAYLATIRLIAIDKMSPPKGNEPPLKPERKKKIKQSLFWLTLADAPLVIAGLLLGLHLFFPTIFDRSAPDWMLTWAIRLFTVAGVLLVIYHLRAWYRSIREFMKD